MATGRKQSPDVRIDEIDIRMKRKVKGYGGFTEDVPPDPIVIHRVIGYLENENDGCPYMTEDGTGIYLMI